MPERIIEKSVKGMLPKGPLGRNLFRKLKFMLQMNIHMRHNNLF